MKKLSLLLLVPVLYMMGCKQPDPTPTPAPPKAPKACFTIDKTLFDSGQLVNFTNCSTNATSYVWNLGDGTTSLSTDLNPKWTYSNGANKGKSYHITMTAYNSDKSKHSDTATDVYMGVRQIDSIKVITVPGTGIKSGTTVLVQMGSVSPSDYSATPMVVNSLPATFVFAPGTVKITPLNKNNGAWKGHIFDNLTHATIYTFGAQNNIFLSRGLNASPIAVTDGAGLSMLVYYSLQKN